ncbi:uncharacterized protein LOC142345365 isoform X2 [Convolutriloba macropyga]|uniref:uncharacterized protein LOC142345365 isoform X2 n=1 Tax=Convolutriloba macropyga TaxID=536237 RepID=UPI003F528396
MESSNGRDGFPSIEVKMNNTSRLRNMTRKQNDREQKQQNENGILKDERFNSYRTPNNVNIGRSGSINSAQNSGQNWTKELEDTVQEEEAELSENRSGGRTIKTNNNINNANNNLRTQSNNHMQVDPDRNRANRSLVSRTPSPKKQLTNHSSFSSASLQTEEGSYDQKTRTINVDVSKDPEQKTSNSNSKNDGKGNNNDKTLNKLPSIQRNGEPQSSMINPNNSLSNNSSDRDREFQERAKKYSDMQKQKKLSSASQQRLSLPSNLTATDSTDRQSAKLPQIESIAELDDKKQQQSRKSCLLGIVSMVSSWNGGERYQMKVQASMHQVFTFHSPSIVNRVGLFKPQPDLCDSGYERLIFKTGQLVYFLGKVTMAELGVEGGILSSPFQIEAGLFLWLDGLEGSMLKYTKSLLTILELPLVSCRHLNAPPVVQVFPVKKTKREWMSIVHSGKFPPPQLLDTNLLCQSKPQQPSAKTDSQAQPRTHAQTARYPEQSQKQGKQDGSLTERAGRKSVTGNSFTNPGGQKDQRMPNNSKGNQSSEESEKLNITQIRINISPIIERFKATRSKNKPIMISSQFQSQLQMTGGAHNDPNNNNATMSINPSADDRLLLWLRMDPSLKLTTSIQFHPPTIYYQKIREKLSSPKL